MRPCRLSGRPNPSATPRADQPMNRVCRTLWAMSRAARSSLVWLPSAKSLVSLLPGREADCGAVQITALLEEESVCRSP
jgi:hypothetical protein